MLPEAAMREYDHLSGLPDDELYYGSGVDYVVDTSEGWTAWTAIDPAKADFFKPIYRREAIEENHGVYLRPYLEETQGTEFFD